MIKILIPAAFFALLILSCKNENNEAGADRTASVVREDSVEMEKVDTVLNAESFEFFNQSGFTDFARSKVDGFDWSKFKLVNVYKDDSLVTSPFNPDEQFYKIYEPFLKRSPDSSKLIDLDSYNIEIKKNSNGQLTGEEMGPDNEVSLIDLDDKKRKRLIFMGPGGSVEDGAWLDNETLILVGVHENQDGKTKSAVVWKYHLPTSTFYLYEMPDPVSAEKLMGEWRAKRLKSVRIQ